MDFAKGGLLIVAGLFVLWIAVTGRTQKLMEAIGVVRSKPGEPKPEDNPTSESNQFLTGTARIESLKATNAANLAALPELVTLPAP